MNRTPSAAWLMLLLGTATSAIAASRPSLYSAKQAADGQVVFTQNCAACHSSDLSGGVGPALIGQDFAPPSGGTTVGSTFKFLSSQMPDGNGGSLSHTQYADVMAFILGKNGYPAGTASFGYDAGQVSTIPLISQGK